MVGERLPITPGRKARLHNPFVSDRAVRQSQSYLLPSHDPGAINCVVTLMSRSNLEDGEVEPSFQLVKHGGFNLILVFDHILLGKAVELQANHHIEAITFNNIRKFLVGFQLAVTGKAPVCQTAFYYEFDSNMRISRNSLRTRSSR